MTMAESTLEAVFSYHNLVHAVAGAAGSVTAMTIFFPLETARTRLQIDETRRAQHTPEILAEIAREEGLESLYRGWFPVITSVCCSNFVYFYTFRCIRAVCVNTLRNKAALKDLVIGMVAGVINVLMTTPLWVVNMRLKLQGARFQTQHFREDKHPFYHGIWDALTRILRDEGVQGLWGGTMSSLVLVSNPAIHFMIYEAIKRYMNRFASGRELSGLQYFFCGAIAKMVATLITYPLQIVQSKLRYGKEEELQQYRNHLGRISAVIRHILQVQGASGLYKGLEAKLLQTVFTAALMFLTYEKIAAFIFKLMRAQ
ncbi:peroxisomal membrane protein PMP34-like [Amphiura filiformis]|uniref:peroxisomal membrane protein PMP34-like n=1 Tax=Amphiura filiformis TaxID=82378 RepID=UPI003B21DED9